MSSSPFKVIELFTVFTDEKYILNSVFRAGMGTRARMSIVTLNDRGVCFLIRIFSRERRQNTFLLHFVPYLTVSTDSVQK